MDLTSVDIYTEVDFFLVNMFTFNFQKKYEWDGGECKDN